MLQIFTGIMEQTRDEARPHEHLVRVHGIGQFEMYRTIEASIGSITFAIERIIVDLGISESGDRVEQRPRQRSFRVSYGSSELDQWCSGRHSIVSDYPTNLLGEISGTVDIETPCRHLHYPPILLLPEFEPEQPKDLRHTITLDRDTKQPCN